MADRIIGERLRQFRLQRNMKQSELAEAAKVTQATVSYLETGVQGMHANTALALARALRVSLDDLLGLEDGFVAEGETASKDEYPNRRRLRLLPEFIELPEPVKAHIVGILNRHGDVSLFDWIDEVRRALRLHERDELDLPNARPVPTVEELEAKRRGRS
jgi:transcriptional regulator with XRE-family HTH domain